VDSDRKRCSCRVFAKEEEEAHIDLSIFVQILEQFGVTREAASMSVALEAQYAAVFENPFEAIAVTDLSGAIRSANQAVTRIFGFLPDEILGRDMSILLPDTIIPGASASDELERDVSGSSEADGRRKDGTVFPVDLGVAEWRIEGGRYFTIIMRDASRRKAAETILANREAHLASLYSQSGAGLAETNESGQFVAVNDRYCQIVGRSRESLLGLTLQDITHPEDLQQSLPLFNQLISRDAMFSIEERYIKGDGSTVWVTKTASPIKTKNGKSMALVVAIDVTERALVQRALRDSEERFRHLHNDFAHFARVNDLGEMAAAIAHEINQPLTAIANYLNAALVPAAGQSCVDALAEAREAMGRAAEQGLRAGAIVRGLREFVAKGAGARNVEKADTLAEAAMALALIGVGGGDIEVKFVPAGPDARVDVDSVQVQQVLVNLLRNAVDALMSKPPASHRLITITATDLRDQGVVEFCVNDDGPGIALDIRDRLFEPFVTSKAQGMGMGLSVSRRIIEAHGGTIEADASTEHGTTFKVRLPRHSDLEQ
jgi:two-component system sensor kinase FixL